MVFFFFLLSWKSDELEEAVGVEVKVLSLDQELYFPPLQKRYKNKRQNYEITHTYEWYTDNLLIWLRVDPEILRIKNQKFTS